MAVHAFGRSEENEYLRFLLFGAEQAEKQEDMLRAKVCATPISMICLSKQSAAL